MELKPCPFCGGKARQIHLCGSSHHIACTECFSQSGPCDSEEQAVTKWNRRTEKVGRWEEMPGITAVGGGILFRCTQCRKMPFPMKKDNYCPHCGARMEAAE